MKKVVLSGLDQTSRSQWAQACSGNRWRSNCSRACACARIYIIHTNALSARRHVRPGQTHRIRWWNWNFKDGVQDLPYGINRCVQVIGHIKVLSMKQTTVPEGIEGRVVYSRAQLILSFKRFAVIRFWCWVAYCGAAKRRATTLRHLLKCLRWSKESHPHDVQITRHPNYSMAVSNYELQ